MRLALVALLFLTACGSAESLDASAGVELPVVIDNHGGDLEGHTPRGFAGSGTGLFAGDNLNANFPNDDGIQIWLTFDIPAGARVPTTAVLRSEVLDPRGTPFEDLGVLNAQPVTYAAFDRSLFDLAPDGPAVACRRLDAAALECEVTNAVRAALESGGSRVQFRLLFDEASDGDGQADLARFTTGDPNVNEPGIFTLHLS